MPGDLYMTPPRSSTNRLQSFNRPVPYKPPPVTLPVTEIKPEPNENERLLSDYSLYLKQNNPELSDDDIQSVLADLQKMQHDRQDYEIRQNYQNRQQGRPVTLKAVENPFPVRR